MTPVLSLARPEIVSLKPYSHAAWLPHLTRMHANEAPWRPSGDGTAAGLNRYPEPQPKELIARLAGLYRVPEDCVLATRGADEGIDILSRIYLRAGQDAILQVTPTFGMYQVSARIQGAEVVEVPLRRERAWALEPKELLSAWRPSMKLVYLCSPNNPTANLFDPASIEKVCAALDGKAIVVIDEAYVEWSRSASLTPWLERFQTLAVLRTLSKAHALAGARVGALLARPEMISLGKRVIPPYALAQPTVEASLRALAPDEVLRSQQRIESLLIERDRMQGALRRSPLVEKVWHSDANFLLIDCRDAQRFMDAGEAAGLIVRDLRGYAALASSLRVSISTATHNDTLLRCVGAA
jgi:histidinol-phosphate aminotransferase